MSARTCVCVVTFICKALLTIQIFSDKFSWLLVQWRHRPDQFSSNSVSAIKSPTEQSVSGLAMYVHMRVYGANVVCFEEWHRSTTQTVGKCLIKSICSNVVHSVREIAWYKHTSVFLDHEIHAFSWWFHWWIDLCVCFSCTIRLTPARRPRSGIRPATPSSEPKRCVTPHARRLLSLTARAPLTQESSTSFSSGSVWRTRARARDPSHTVCGWAWPVITHACCQIHVHMLHI